MSRMGERMPEWAVDSSDTAGRMRQFALDSIRNELRAFREERLPERCPEIDAQGAREGARIGGLLDLLLAGYRSGQQAQWEAWLDLVEEQASDPELRRLLLERGSRFFYEYADRLSGFATDEYTRERDRILRSREQRRVHSVRELLDGRETEPVGLDYELDQRHLGVVAWGPEAEPAARALAEELDRRALLVGVVEETWWGWLGGRTPLTDAAFADFRPSAGTGLALGADLEGLNGFRRTHRQAERAQRIAIARGELFADYEQVALEALASVDHGEASAFARRELRGIDGGDRRAARLRETLEAYFATGHNAAAAAARLGVHEQTIAQRLRTVEERVGRSVSERRAELEVALRLRRSLGPPSAAEADSASSD